MNQKDKRNTAGEIPDWKCERFLLNELDEAEMEEIRRAMKADEGLRARLEALERSNREILGEYPPVQMGHRIRGRLASDVVAKPAVRRDRGFRIARALFVPVGLTAVIAFAVFVLPSLIPSGDLNESDLTRIKGASQELRLFRKTASGSQQLHDRDPAAAHDLIRIQYQTEDHEFGAILSVDGWGTITRHLPQRGGQAAELELRRAHFLDYAYELDDAPHWEVFVFVTSASAFPIDTVIQSIEESLSFSQVDTMTGAYVEVPRELDLPEGLRVERFTLLKKKGARHEE